MLKSYKVGALLDGDGEMARLTRNHNWSGSSLGSPEEWPISLRSYVGALLHSDFPMLLFWGQDAMVTFYNDAFVPSLGHNGKHPSLGKPAREMWSDIWGMIGPLLKQVMDTNQSVYFEDQLVPFYRNGRIEDIYWTFCYGPAYADDGNINGVLVTCTETTKKVVNTRELIEGKNKLEFAIDAAELGTWDLNAITGKFSANERLKEWFGLREEEEIILSNALSAIDENDRVRVTEAINKAMEYDSGGTYSETYTIVHPRSGYRRIVRAKGKAKFNEDHKAIRLNGTLQDITEQVHGNSKLEKSESHLELVSNTVPAMIFYLDEHQRYTTYNETFMNWFGVDKTGALGKTVREFLGETAYKITKPHLEIAYSGQQEKYEMLSPARFSKSRWLSIVYTPHILDGKVLGLIVHATDITQSKQTEMALRESEERFRLLVEEAPVATCLFIGRELRVDIANDAMLSVWGKNRSIIGKNLADAVPELRGQPFLRLLDQVYTTGIPYSESAARADLEVGGVLGTYYFNFTYKALFDINGKVYGIMDMAVDVTAQVLATQKIEEVISIRTHELAEANRLLEQSNRELEQFAYVASHDLQEPLRKVMTFTSLLENHISNLDTQSQLYFNKITTSTLRMVKLIRDVLDFSRLSDKDNIFEAVDLASITDNLLQDFELLISEKSAVVKYDNLPVLHANALQMRQLFSNLLSNALKFTRAGETPRIIMQSAILPENSELLESELLAETDYCHITVSDNGIGINEEFAEKIFGIFQRLHSKHEFEGTGIGLALSKKIVQNHHGKIWAASSPSGGTVFHVLLPAITFQ